MYSYLDLVRQVDSVPYVEDGVTYTQNVAQCYTFKSHDGVVLGHVLPFVAEHMKLHPDIFVHQGQSVSLVSSLDSFDKRNNAMAWVVDYWRQNKTFAVLEGWRDERYVVYNPTSTPYLLVERAASCLFGIVTYGIHITGYVPAHADQPLQIWVPRRSQTKPTYPGMLDNTVAGGLGYPHGVLDTAIKECQEEAGLNEDYVAARLEPVGVISYMFQASTDLSSEAAVFQPEVEYLYEIQLDSTVVPTPIDGEVASFELMSLEKVDHCLRQGLFKYNCSLVIIDFMMRHSLLNPEDEAAYLEISQRIHRKLPYPCR